MPLHHLRPLHSLHSCIINSIDLPLVKNPSEIKLVPNIALRKVINARQAGLKGCSGRLLLETYANTWYIIYQRACKKFIAPSAEIAQQEFRSAYPSRTFTFHRPPSLQFNEHLMIACDYTIETLQLKVTTINLGHNVNTSISNASTLIDVLIACGPNLPNCRIPGRIVEDRVRKENFGHEFLDFYCNISKTGDNHLAGVLLKASEEDLFSLQYNTVADEEEEEEPSDDDEDAHSDDLRKRAKQEEKQRKFEERRLRNSKIFGKGDKRVYCVRRDPEEEAVNDTLERIDIARIMFNSLVDRISAYQLRSHMGLIKFSDKVQVVSPIVSSVELFREALQDLKATGDTCLYDAITKAADMLVDYKGNKKADAVKRILVLTDGDDTCSSATINEIKSTLRTYKARKASFFLSVQIFTTLNS